MSDVLDRAKEVQGKVAGETNVWMKLSFLQELIEEIERLEAALLHKARQGETK